MRTCSICGSKMSVMSNGPAYCPTCNRIDPPDDPGQFVTFVKDHSAGYSGWVHDNPQAFSSWALKNPAAVVIWAQANPQDCAAWATSDPTMFLTWTNANPEEADRISGAVKMVEQEVATAKYIEDTSKNIAADRTRVLQLRAAGRQEEADQLSAQTTAREQEIAYLAQSVDPAPTSVDVRATPNGPAVGTPGGSTFGWGVLGFFVPVAGLILYLVWKNSQLDRRKGASAGKGALISVILGVIVTIIYAIVIGIILNSLS